MLNINGKKISSVFFGSTEIARGYSGSQLVFQKNVGEPTSCYPVNFEWNMDAGGSPNNILLTETGPNTKIWVSNENPQEGESVLQLTDEGDYYLLHSYQAPDLIHADNARGYKNGATTPWDDRVVWLTRDSDNWESFTTPSDGHIEQFAEDFIYIKKWRDPQEGDVVTIDNNTNLENIITVQYTNSQFVATINQDKTLGYYNRIQVNTSADGFRFYPVNSSEYMSDIISSILVTCTGSKIDKLICSKNSASLVEDSSVNDVVVMPSEFVPFQKTFPMVANAANRWVIYPVNYPNTIYVYGTDANSNSVAGTYVVEQQNNADRHYHDRPVYYCAELNKRLFYAQGGLGDYAWVFDTSVHDVDGDFAPFGYLYAYEPSSGFVCVTDLSTWNNMYGAMSDFTVSETPPPATPLPAYTTPVYVYGNNADSNNLTGTYSAVIENGEPVAHNNRIVYYCSATNKYLLYAEGMVDDYAWVFLNTIRDYGIDFYAGGDVFGYASGTRVTDVSSWNYGMSSLSNFIVSTTAPSQGVITTSNVTINGTVGTAISQIDLINYVTVSNGNTPSFSGSVPSGLSLTSSGSITGTPTSADSGTYQITVSANGCTSATLTITANITAAPTPTPGDTLTSTWSGSVNPTYANMNNATWTENNGVWTTTSAPGWEIYLAGTFYRLVYNGSEMTNNGTDSTPTGTYTIDGWGTLTVVSGGGSLITFPTTVYVTNTPGTASVGGTYNQTSYYNTVDGIQYPVYSNGSFYYSYSGSRWIFTSGYPVESGPYYEAATATTEMVTTYQDGPMMGGSPYPVVSLTSGGGSTEPVTNPTSLTVSNAGNSGDNGTFVQNGTMNGYPMYQKENGNPVIFYSNGHWYLCDDIEQWNMTIASDYVSATDDLTGTWNVGHYGSSPAPTVTAGSSGGGGSSPTPTGSGYQVTFSDTYSQSYNGTYTDSGATNNGKPVYTSGSNALWMYKRYAPWIGDDEYYWIIGPASNVTENDNGDPIWEAYYPFAGSISGSSADPTDVSYWSNGAGMEESVTITSIGGSGGGQQSGSITFPSGNTVSISGEEGQTLSSVNLASYVSVSNGSSPSFSASSLPSGLSLSSSGVLSGTPSSSDYSSYSITVSASGCSSVTLTLQMNISSSAGPEPEPEPSGELPVYNNTVDPVYEVSNNSNTSGVYYLATKYNTWNSNGESWDTPVENSGSFNGYPVYYNPDKDMYLFYYNHGSGNCWALNHYVMNWNVPASETGLFVDYDGTYSTSPSGDYSNGSRVYAYDPCLVAGTKITLADGSKKNVEDITYDDELLVWNFDEGKYDKAKPLWIMKERVTHNWYFNKFSDKTVLKTVGSKGGGHRMFSINQNNFDYPMNSVGYDIVMQNGSTAILESTKLINSEVKYYNIITNKHMNLYANGVLTSCHLNNLYPVSNMKFVKKANNAITDLNGIPQEYIDGLRLTEQPGDVGNYVRRLLTLAKER